VSSNFSARLAVIGAEADDLVELNRTLTTTVSGLIGERDALQATLRAVNDTLDAKNDQIAALQAALIAARSTP